ncbi:MAG: peroxiredoxin [Thermoplasmata archaeon]
MIGIGSAAPDFESMDSRGEKFRLSGLRGKKVVLYFFPKAFTGGCTMETKQFAEISPSLSSRGVEVVGISVDPAETQTRFAAHCAAPFPIVSDPSKAIARSYGVLSFIGFSKRVTFYIDEGGIVRDIVASMLPGPHVARARQQ